MEKDEIMKYKKAKKHSPKMWNRLEKFSIRKFSIGAASCLIGAQIAISGLANTVEAAMSTFRDQKGGNVTTLYSNGGDTPFEASGSGVYDKVNVDQEITMDIDWSQYSKTNPYVTVTYKYNGGYGSAASNNYGGGRPDFWFTTPIGALEPETITLYNQNTGANGREMTSWSGAKPWVSFTNSVGSRYQTAEAAKTLGAGDPTKWERYNDTTGENGRTYRGDLDTMFWRRIGDQIGGSPSDQGIYKSFRDNTKTMYSDWQKAADPTATIKAKYKIADPTLKNNRLTLDFGAGVKVGHAGSLVTHFKVTTVEIPILYKDNELFEPSVPERTGVVDATNLTTAEKTDLKNKIWEKNKATISNSIPESSHNKFIDNVKQGDDGTATADSSISIAADGTATITYLDGSQDTIPGTSLVYEKPQIDNNETTPGEIGGYKYLKNPHLVDNINNLSVNDIESARRKFFEVNRMTTTKNEDNDDVIQSVGDSSKTSSEFIGTNLEYDSTKQGFAILRSSTPTGATIPKADLFKQKPTKVFNADETIQKEKDAIDKLKYLSPKEKEYFKNQLTGKTAQNDINNVVNAAIAKNSENEKAIEAKKREIKDKINGLKYLTKEEKDNFINQVNNQVITDPADGDGTGTKALDNTKTLLDNILTNANAKNLEKAKKQAKAEIEKIKDDLTNPTAADYNSRIDDANTDTTTKVEAIVEEAKKQKALKDKAKAQEEANNLKEEYKKKIDQIPGLSDADKTEYKKQIEAATSKNQLDNIIKDAEAKATRNKAIETITNLPHLNKAQKADLIEQVKDATDKEEVEDVVTKAQGLDAKMDSLQQLVAKANDVKNTDKYTNATSATKTPFDTALTNADAVANKETGKEADASEVDSLIDKLKEAIKNLTGEEVAKPVSKAALEAEVAKEAEVHKSPAYLKDNKAKQDEYDKALNEAKTVLKDTAATQDDVDAALDKLQKACLALSGKAEDFTLAVASGSAEISKDSMDANTLKNDEDKNAVKAKLKVDNAPVKDTDKVEYGTITDKDGKKYVTVTVTRDGVSKEDKVEVVYQVDINKLKDKAKAELEKAAEKEKEDIKADNSLSDSDKKELNDKVDKAKKDATDNINTATTVKGIEDAKQKGEQAIKAVHQSELDKKKAEAKKELETAAEAEKKEIESDLTLDPDTKVQKKKEVDKVKEKAEKAVEDADTEEKVTTATTEGKTDIAAVHTVDVDKVKEKAKADLTEAADAEKAEINADNGLTTSEKTELKNKVDDVKGEHERKIDKETTAEGIAKATTAGKQAIAGVHTPTDIKDKSKKLTAPQEKVKVKDLNQLTDTEKEDVKEAVKKANPNSNLSDDDITVDDKGNVTTPKGYLLPEDVIVPALNKPTTPVTVTDPNHLTTDEQKEVQKAVSEANKDSNLAPDDVHVDDKGNVKTNNNGNLPASDVVVQKLKKPATPVEVVNPKKLTDTEKEEVKTAIVEANKDANGNPTVISKQVTVHDDGRVETPIGNLNSEDVVKVKTETTPQGNNTDPAVTLKGEDLVSDLPELSVQNALVAGVVTVEKGQPLTDEDIKKQLVLTEDMVVNSIKKPSTTETGNKEAEVEITLADGSKVTVKVPVVVVESLENANTGNDLAKAKEDAKKVVEDAANKKIEDINNRTDLSDDEKTEAVEKVNKAKDDANTQIDNATSSGTAKAIGDAAAANIQKFNPEHNSVGDIDPVDTSNLDEEKAKAIAEIGQAAKDQINAINNNKGLTSSQKAEAIKQIEDKKAKAIEDVHKATTVGEVENIVKEVLRDIKGVNPQPYSGYSYGDDIHSSSDAQANAEALANAKESAKNAIEKAAKDKQDEIKDASLSDKEQAELLAKVEAEKESALKAIETAKTVEDVKEAETIGLQAIASVTVPKKPVAPNAAAPQATSAPQATAGTMQDVTYQSPAGKQLPNTGSASSAALASLGLVAATSGFALLGRKARRRK